MSKKSQRKREKDRTSIHSLDLLQNLIKNLISVKPKTVKLVEENKGEKYFWPELDKDLFDDSKWHLDDTKYNASKKKKWWIIFRPN